MMLNFPCWCLGLGFKFAVLFHNMGPKHKQKTSILHVGALGRISISRFCFATRARNKDINIVRSCWFLGSLSTFASLSRFPQAMTKLNVVGEQDLEPEVLAHFYRGALTRKAAYEDSVEKPLALPACPLGPALTGLGFTSSGLGHTWNVYM